MCAVPRRSLRLTTERLTIRPLESPATSPSSRATATCPTSPATRTGRSPTRATWRTPLVDDAEELGVPTPRQWLQLAVTTDADDRLLGDVAVWLDDAALLAMIGYTLAPEHQGQGYAPKRSGDRRLAVRGAQGAPRRGHDRPRERGIGSACSSATGSATSGPPARRRWCAASGPTTPASRSSPTTGGRGAAAGPATRVELVEITPETVRRVGELDRAFSQRRFVSSVYESYGDALVAPDHDGESGRPWFRAIDGRRRAGRLHDGRRADADPAPPYLWRLHDRLAPPRSWHRPRRDRGARAATRAATGATHLLLSCTADVTGTPGAVLPTARLRAHRPRQRVGRDRDDRPARTTDRTVNARPVSRLTRSRRVERVAPRARRPERAGRRGRRRCRSRAWRAPAARRATSWLAIRVAGVVLVHAALLDQPLDRDLDGSMSTTIVAASPSRGFSAEQREVEHDDPVGAAWASI